MLSIICFFEILLSPYLSYIIPVPGSLKLALKLKDVSFFRLILHLAGFSKIILGGVLSFHHKLTVLVIDLE